MAILAQPWPPDLDPKRVPYRTRTITTLQRMGAWDDPARFAELNIDEVAAYWVTGPVTITDLVNTSEAAIGWHLNESRELASVAQDESWTRQVWHRDRRFADLAPRVDATVYEIAVAGHHDDQRHLYESLPALGERLVELTAESRDAALIRYVSANTGQNRQRTTRLLQSLHLLEPHMTGTEAGRQLGVSQQRISQLVGQIRNRIELATPPGADPWLPQDPDAIGSIFE